MTQIAGLSGAPLYSNAKRHGPSIKKKSQSLQMLSLGIGRLVKSSGPSLFESLVAVQPCGPTLPSINVLEFPGEECEQRFSSDPQEGQIHLQRNPFAPRPLHCAHESFQSSIRVLSPLTPRSFDQDGCLRTIKSALWSSMEDFNVLGTTWDNACFFSADCIQPMQISPSTTWTSRQLAC